MALTPVELAARLKQTQENATAFRDYWVGLLPALPPPNHELLTAARKIPLGHLAMAIEAYADKICKGEVKQTTNAANDTANALKYICATALNIAERQDPQDRPMTPRRVRNQNKAPNE